MNIEETLTDEDFASGFSGGVLEAGKYKVRVVGANPRIKVSKAGNRYLNIALAAVETASGEKVKSDLIYHSVPFEGTNKSGGLNRKMFAGFVTALGLDKDAARSVFASLMETAPSADSIDPSAKTEVQLTINGDSISLAGRELMASIKTEDYEGTTSNRISSLWAVKAE